MYSYIPGEEKLIVATFCSVEDVGDVVIPVKQKIIMPLILVLVLSYRHNDIPVA